MNQLLLICTDGRAIGFDERRSFKTDNFHVSKSGLVFSILATKSQQLCQNSYPTQVRQKLCNFSGNDWTNSFLVDCSLFLSPLCECNKAIENIEKDMLFGVHQVVRSLPGQRLLEFIGSGHTSVRHARELATIYDSDLVTPLG